MASSNEAIAVAMRRLWDQYLPQIEERVASLEVAANAVSGDTLGQDLRASAGSAAHKLAGVLGTFGLDLGTQLAREAEAFYCSDKQAGPSQADRLMFIASQI